MLMQQIFDQMELGICYLGFIVYELRHVLSLILENVVRIIF
jgi:hypothetical protein